MIALVLAALGQLAELLNRLTTSRAGNLDNLNATISSRAAASTAMDKNVWTDAKAGFIDVSIASRAKANAQTGYVSTTSVSTSTGEDIRYVDVTITAVSAVAKCIVIFDGASGASLAAAQSISGSADAYRVTARLTSTTNLRLAMPHADAAIVGRWQVIDLGAS